MIAMIVRRILNHAKFVGLGSYLIQDKKMLKLFPHNCNKLFLKYKVLWVIASILRHKFNIDKFEKKCMQSSQTQICVIFKCNDIFNEKTYFFVLEYRNPILICLCTRLCKIKSCLQQNQHHNIWNGLSTPLSSQFTAYSFVNSWCLIFKYSAHITIVVFYVL